MIDDGKHLRFLFTSHASEIIRWPKNMQLSLVQGVRIFERKSRSTTSCDLKHSDPARQCIAVAQRCPDITEGCGNSGEVHPQHLVSKSKKVRQPVPKRLRLAR